MKLLLSVELPGQTGWQLPADWAAALLAALRQTLALEYPAGRPGSENYGSCEVSLTLTDNAQIWQLNQQFRQVERQTDVLCSISI